MYEEYVIGEGWLALYAVLEHPCCDDCAISCSFQRGTFYALSPYSKLLQLSVWMTRDRSVEECVLLCVFEKEMKTESTGEVGCIWEGDSNMQFPQQKKEQAEGWSWTAGWVDNARFKTCAQTRRKLDRLKKGLLPMTGSYGGGYSPKLCKREKSWNLNV